MVTVTDTARGKLEEILNQKGVDPEKTIRIVDSTSKDSDLDFIWDQERKGDFVIKNDEERPLLVIKQNLADKLSGMALDYVETSDGDGFIVKKTDADT
jgi:Fe-S cluster assembly iron-binding protein IscA